MSTYPHNYKLQNEKCMISIDGQSYDVTSWRNHHPGGAESIDNFHNKDATEAFYALHSKEAISKLKKMYSTTTDFKAMDI